MPTPVERTVLPIEMIEATAATQVRVRKDPGTIKAYAEDLGNGAEFPPIEVYREENSERYILADGFHRLHAFVDQGRTEIEANIYEGDMHDALIHALGANHNHGLRLTNADKRNAVQIALKDPQIGELSLREIADICRVSHMTVARLRNESSLLDEEPDSSDHNPDGERPDEADEDDRAVKREATQAEVDTIALKTALQTITGMAFPGTGIYERTVPDEELEKLVMDATVWLTDAAMLVARRQSE